MGAPWAYGPKEFTVPAGESSLIQINMPYRGTLRSLSLAAVDGEGGSFEIYNSEDAARRAVAEANGSSESAAVGLRPSDYVVYEGDLTSGAKVERDIRIPYVNNDGSPTNGDPRLWMRLAPEGSGELIFVLSLVIEGVDFWG